MEECISAWLISALTAATATAEACERQNEKSGCRELVLDIFDKALREDRQPAEDVCVPKLTLEDFQGDEGHEVDQQEWILFGRFMMGYVEKKGYPGALATMQAENGVHTLVSLRLSAQKTLQALRQLPAENRVHHLQSILAGATDNVFLVSCMAEFASLNDEEAKAKAEAAVKAAIQHVRPTRGSQEASGRFARGGGHDDRGFGGGRDDRGFGRGRGAARFSRGWSREGRAGGDFDRLRQQSPSLDRSRENEKRSSANSGPYAPGGWRARGPRIFAPRHSGQRQRYGLHQPFLPILISLPAASPVSLPTRTS